MPWGAIAQDRLSIITLKPDIWLSGLAASAMVMA
jgi:hypothetical protein